MRVRNYRTVAMNARYDSFAEYPSGYNIVNTPGFSWVPAAAV